MVQLLDDVEKEYMRLEAGTSSIEARADAALNALLAKMDYDQ